MNWDAIGSVATAVAVFVAAWQVRRGTQQSRTDFEDNLTREYRNIIRALPVDVHLGATPNEETYQGILPHLYRYIDLTNEQVFLRLTGRVSRATWFQWRDGIESTLKLPAFARAWEYVQANAPDRFTELRRLLDDGFDVDPRSQMSRWQRLRQALRP